MEPTSRQSRSEFRSQLPEAGSRFVAEVLADCVVANAQMASAVLRRFPPDVLLAALEHDQDRRVRLLVDVTGTHEKIAAKKSIASATEDLELALDEGTTSPDEIVNLFTADEWIDLLGVVPVWRFLTEDSSWLRSGSGDEPLRRARLVLERGIAQELLTEADVIGLLPLAEVTARLTNKQLRAVVTAALTDGRSNLPFTAARLNEVLGHEELLTGVSGDLLWDTIIFKLLAPDAEDAATGKHPLPVPTATKAAAPAKSEPPAEAPTVAAEPPRAARDDSDITLKAVSEPQAAEEPAVADAARDEAAAPVAEPPRTEVAETTSRVPAKPHPAPPPPSAPPASLKKLSTDALPDTASDVALDDLGDGALESLADATPAPGSQRLKPPPPPHQRLRTPPPPPRRSTHRPEAEDGGPMDPLVAQVCRRLAALDRLPPGGTDMPLVLLRSIESMYSELAATQDAADQLAIMQDSYPNEAFQRQAMIALLRLHDPDILSNNPTIEEESPDSLAVRLLTEERQRSRHPEPRNSIAIPVPASAALGDEGPPSEGVAQANAVR